MTLPTGWARTTLGAVASPSSSRVKPEADDRRRFLSLEHVEPHSTKVLGSIESREVRSTAVEFQEGDTLYARLRPYLNKVCVAPFSGLGSAEFFVFPRTPYLAAGFLRFFLNQPEFVAFASSVNEGDRPRVKWDQVESFPFALPPLNEQRRIVEAIETHLSRLDAGVEALERASRNTERMRTAVLKAAVEGKLVPSVTLELWPIVTLADVCEVVSGQTPKGVTHVPGGTIPYFKVGDMNLAEGRRMAASRVYLDNAAVESLKLRLRPPGTIIFPKRGGAIQTNKKRVLVEPSAFDLNTMGVVPGPDVDSRYLWLWLSNIDLASLADGSNVPQINHGDIKPLTLPLPPLEAQRLLAEEADRQLSILDAIAAEVEGATGRASDLRRAVLACAFTGRLVTQDLTDEPASVLLDRIRSEREKAPV